MAGNIDFKSAGPSPGPAPQTTNPLQDTFIKLEQAEQLRQRGKLDRAQRICESLLREHPKYMAALHTLGLIYADRANPQQALNCLVRAAMLNPRSWTTLTALSGIYLELDANEMAAQTLELARAIKPHDANVLVTLGVIYNREREYELAKEAFAQAKAADPTLLPAFTGYGSVCASIGEDAEAATTFEGVIRGGVGSGVGSFEALAALSALPASLVSIDLLSELDHNLSRYSLKNVDEDMIPFVRAAALAKAGRHDEAWEVVVPANRKVFQGMQKDLRDTIDRRRVVTAALRTAPLESSSGRLEDGQPISLFILGPSRSGKTTMEQLVAGFDGLKRGYENPAVDNAIRRAFQSAGLISSGFFEVLPPLLHPLCKEIYMEELVRRAGSAKVFTNTHPGRINDAALMAAVFPNVRFVFVKRNPEDIVLRIFMRKYRTGNAYAYDLRAARDQVTWYHEMMDLLAEKLPDRVRIIDYEDMVTDPAGALRVAADLCGLPMPEGPVPAVGDDRGSAEPYRDLMARALQEPT